MFLNYTFFLHVHSQLFDFLRVSTGKALDTRRFGRWGEGKEDGDGGKD